MPSKGEHVDIEVDGRTVRVSNPSKVFFTERNETKLDLVNYYLAVGQGALKGVATRPTVMKRYPNGAEGDFFFQKRVPENRPDWLQTVTVAFPSGRTATELCPIDVAHLIWAVNLGCLDLNPWPVRRWDVHHPDELRVDLDPQPGVEFAAVRTVALHVREVLAEHGLEGYPKTTGSRGIHINIRIVAKWGFDDVRRAALALARAVERRIPEIATSKWWKEERGERVFLDYNQNAVTAPSRPRIRCARIGTPSSRAQSRGTRSPTSSSRTSASRQCPRYASIGDPGATIDDHAYSLEPLLELAARDEREGLGDAPWPPHFRKQPGEARRVAPSRKAKGTDDQDEDNG